MPLHKDSQKEIILRTLKERGGVDIQRLRPMLRALFPGRSASTYTTLINRLLESGMLERRCNITEKGLQALDEAVHKQAWPPANKKQLRKVENG